MASGMDTEMDRSKVDLDDLQRLSVQSAEAFQRQWLWNIIKDSDRLILFPK